MISLRPFISLMSTSQWPPDRIERNYTAKKKNNNIFSKDVFGLFEQPNRNHTKKKVTKYWNTCTKDRENRKIPVRKRSMKL